MPAARDARGRFVAKGGGARYSSRLPKIAAELGGRMDAVARAVAEVVEEDARQRVPVNTGRLRDAIHTERVKVGEYMVIAGDNKAFYGHIVEHGGARTPAQPFMQPATDDARPRANLLARVALRGL